jgi:hypothetical protein
MEATFPIPKVFGRLSGNQEAVMKSVTLSESALALFRLHVERRGQVDVEPNRETYRELERAGLMACRHTFRDGRDSLYRLTKEGFEKKAELLSHAKEAG